MSDLQLSKNMDNNMFDFLFFFSQLFSPSCTTRNSSFNFLRFNKHFLNNFNINGSRFFAKMITTQLWVINFVYKFNNCKLVNIAIITKKKKKQNQ